MAENELLEIEDQLSCPNGAKGIDIGMMMNETNRGMISKTIEVLKIEAGHQVLELGFGNGGHLAQILDHAPGISYRGLEISPTMKTEAERINAPLSADHDISFTLYDGSLIPFPDNNFHRILSVNTIYFWQNPEILLAELFRVLRPGGFLAITYAQKTFMQTMPFIRDKFRLYDNQLMLELIAKTPFRQVKIFGHTDVFESPLNENTERPFAIAMMKKTEL